MRRFALPAIGLLLVLAAPIRAQEPAAEQKEDPSDRSSVDCSGAVPGAALLASAPSTYKDDTIHP